MCVLTPLCVCKSVKYHFLWPVFFFFFFLEEEKKKVWQAIFFFFFFVLKSSLKNSNKVLLNQGCVWLLNSRVACGSLVQMGRATPSIFVRPRSSAVPLPAIC